MKKSKLLPTVLSMLVMNGCGGSMPVEPRRPVVSLLELRRDHMIKQSWDISCGSAALATVLTYDHNYPVTEREVAADLLKHTPVEKVRNQLGFSLLDLKNFAQSRGFVAGGVGNVSLSDILKIGPSIVPVVIRGFNHFVVFRGIQGDRVLLADPAWGNRTMLLTQFLDIWKSRIAFSVGRRPTEINGMPVAVTFHPLSPHSRDFVASSTLYQRRDIEREALQPVPEINVAATQTPLNNVVAAGTRSLKDSISNFPDTER